MPRRGWLCRLSEWLVLAACVAVLGCESTPGDQAVISGIGPTRRVQGIDSAQPASDDALTVTPPAEVPSQPVLPASTQPAITAEEIRDQIPDPVDEAERVAQQLAKQLGQPDFLEWDRKRHQRLLDRLSATRRPDTVRLSLADAVRRALLNSYFLQASAYEPAIAATQIVEAEAQFDAVYYANYGWTKQDTPSPSQLMSTAADRRNFTSGVRKLLSAGTQVQLGYEVTRDWTTLIFQTLNPSYTNSFFVELRQPFLRGFGLDFNRSQIERYRLERRISVERLQREIRERVFVGTFPGPARRDNPGPADL